MQGDTTIGANARVNPGNSPGRLTVFGDVALDGTLLIEVADLSNFDVFNVVGDITFSSTTMFEFLFDSTFMPTTMTTLDFLFASSFAGIDLLDTGNFLFTGLDPRYVASVGFGDNAFRRVGTLSFALSPTAAPEPGTVALLLVAIALTSLQGGRRRRSAA